MAEFDIKGWCPGALRPMESGDGLVVRIRPRMAQMTAAQVLGVAETALSHGNGIIELTARANVQLRGVTPESHTPLITGLRALGLIDKTAQAAGAGKMTVVEVEEIVETGAIAPDDVHLAGIYVHRLVLNATPEKRIEKRTISEAPRDQAAQTQKAGA